MPRSHAAILLLFLIAGDQIYCVSARPSLPLLATVLAGGRLHGAAAERDVEDDSELELDEDMETSEDGEKEDMHHETSALSQGVTDMVTPAGGGQAAAFTRHGSMAADTTCGEDVYSDLHRKGLIIKDYFHVADQWYHDHKLVYVWCPPFERHGMYLSCDAKVCEGDQWCFVHVTSFRGQVTRRRDVKLNCAMSPGITTDYFAEEVCASVGAGEVRPVGGYVGKARCECPMLGGNPKSFLACTLKSPVNTQTAKQLTPGPFFELPIHNFQKASLLAASLCKEKTHRCAVLNGTMVPYRSLSTVVHDGVCRGLAAVTGGTSVSSKFKKVWKTLLDAKAAFQLGSRGLILAGVAGAVSVPGLPFVLVGMSIGSVLYNTLHVLKWVFCGASTCVSAGALTKLLLGMFLLILFFFPGVATAIAVTMGIAIGLVGFIVLAFATLWRHAIACACDLQTKAWKITFYNLFRHCRWIGLADCNAAREYVKQQQGLRDISKLLPKEQAEDLKKRGLENKTFSWDMVPCDQVIQVSEAAQKREEETLTGMVHKYVSYGRKCKDKKKLFAMEGNEDACKKKCEEISDCQVMTLDPTKTQCLGCKADDWERTAGWTYYVKQSVRPAELLDEDAALKSDFKGTDFKYKEIDYMEVPLKDDHVPQHVDLQQPGH